MKGATLKRLYTEWFQLYDVFKKAKPHRQWKGQWFPGIGGKEGWLSWEQRNLKGQWSYSVLLFCIIILYYTIVVDTCHHMLCLVDQSCLTLCDPMDCSPPGSSVHGDSPGKNTRVGFHALLQGILLTQSLNLGLPHCRRILYQLSFQGSPKILEWVAYLFSRGSSWPRNWTRVSCIAGRFFTSWAVRETHISLYIHQNQ